MSATSTSNAVGCQNNNVTLTPKQSPDRIEHERTEGV